MCTQGTGSWATPTEGHGECEGRLDVSSGGDQSAGQTLLLGVPARVSWEEDRYISYWFCFARDPIHTGSKRRQPQRLEAPVTTASYRLPPRPALLRGLAPPSCLRPGAELVWEFSYRVWTTPAVSTWLYTHQQRFLTGPQPMATVPIPEPALCPLSFPPPLPSSFSAASDCTDCPPTMPSNPVSTLIAFQKKIARNPYHTGSLTASPAHVTSRHKWLHPCPH